MYCDHAWTPYLGNWKLLCLIPNTNTNTSYPALCKQLVSTEHKLELLLALKEKHMH